MSACCSVDCCSEVGIQLVTYPRIDESPAGKAAFSNRDETMAALTCASGHAQVHSKHEK